MEDIKISRNSEMFKEVLESRGMTYANVYYRLNQQGITRFNDILTKSGELVKGEDGRYLGSKDYHSSDKGLRTRAETELDCAVGSIQETLFCLDNIDFKSNPNATGAGLKQDSDISARELDLIHKPTGRQVEFKVSYSKLYGNDAYYHHRDSGLRDFLNAGNIMIIYFIKLGKVAVLTKKYVDRSVKFDKEHILRNNKYWDDIKVWKGLFMDYRMMGGGNFLISDKISNIVKNEMSK